MKLASQTLLHFLVRLEALIFSCQFHYERLESVAKASMMWNVYRIKLSSGTKTLKIIWDCFDSSPFRPRHGLNGKLKDDDNESVLITVIIINISVIIMCATTLIKMQ